MAIELSTSKECRSAYRELLQGYSYCEEKDLYIKHFKEADLGFIDEIYGQCFNSVKKLGVVSMKEKLEFLGKEGYWTKEEEQDFITASLAVKDGYTYLSKMVHKEQRETFRKTVLREQEDHLEKVQKERSELVEPTVETICEKRLNEFYVYHAIYKDRELKEPYFSEEEFDDLSYFELGNLVRAYNYTTSRFTEKNLKKIAVNYFFLNSFFMSEDDPVKFYGKNVLELTMYQMNLFSRGKLCKYVLTEGKEPPDQYYEESYEDGLGELVKWYDQANSQIMNEREHQRLKK